MSGKEIDVYLASPISKKMGEVSSQRQERRIHLFLLIPDPNANLFIWSEILGCIASYQPNQSGKHSGGDPFYDCEHNELLIIAIKKNRNDIYKT